VEGGGRQGRPAGLTVADFPLARLPGAPAALQRANQLRRSLEGRLRSFDLVQWDGVAYGDRPEQRLHWWELNDLAPRDGWPAVLLLHGGGWREGSWRDFEALAPMFARKGIVAAALDYRLAPAHRWPAPLEDVLGALRFLHQQQVDGSRVALWGHSAGGQLALMAMAAEPGLACCAVAFGAPTDLRAQAEAGPDDLSVVFDDLDAASPIRHLGPEGPPIRLVHGGADRVVDVGQARALRAALPERVDLDEVAEGDHGLRWPPIAGLRARRRALAWVVEQMRPAGRGSKWKLRRKKKR
jgi:acetyl esterase/lipase